MENKNQNSLYQYFLYSFIIHVILFGTIKIKDSDKINEIISDVSLFYGSTGLSESFPTIENKIENFEFYDKQGVVIDDLEDVLLKKVKGKKEYNFERNSGLEWNFGFKGKKFKGFDKFSSDSQNTGAESITGPAGTRKILRKFYPEYPQWAKANGIEGIVELKFWVDNAGLVIKVEIEKTSGNTHLDNDAVMSMKKWLFDTRIKDELDWGKIKIIYKLN